jgi:hypothetical protein
VRKEYNNWLKENRMETNYNSCQSTRLEIDKLLRLNSALQASLGTDSTDQERLIIKSKTEELMNKIKEIDPEFHNIINVN